MHLEHGFVAVKNRNSRSKTKKEDLSGCWSTESAWFAKESAFRYGEKENTAVAAELSDRLGLCALLKKIDTVFCKHLNEHWVPKEVAAVDKELAALQVRQDEVCNCLRRLDGSDLTNFVEHIRSRIASVLSDSQLERWCQEYVLARLQKASGQWDKNSLVACLRGVHKAKADLAGCFADAPTHFSSVFETALASEFNKASPSPGDLGDPACWVEAYYDSTTEAWSEQAGVRVPGPRLPLPSLVRHAAAVQVSGATGSNSEHINGVYRPVGEGDGGKPVYKKDGADTWIEYWPGKEQWQLKPGSHKGMDSAWMVSLGDQKEAGVVEEATAGWQVYDSTTKVWSEQAGVRVVRCVFAQGDPQDNLGEPGTFFFKIY